MPRCGEGPVEAGTITVTSTSRTQFVARKKLKEVKHTNSIRDYVRDFSACMLEISDMSETDKTFEFINGLKRWVQPQVMRQNPRTLSAAISAVERLLDFHGELRVGSNRFRYRDVTLNQGVHRKCETQTGSSTKKPFAGFVCKGPHKMAECPNKVEFNMPKGFKSILTGCWLSITKSMTKTRVMMRTSRDWAHYIGLMRWGNWRNPMRRRPRDSCVGKSCLLLRFSDGSFTTSFITTIGIDFKIRTIELDGKRIKLQIWDTAGQERFRTITTAYYRGAMGILLVYDVTDESSFNNIRNWIRNIEQHASDNVNKILVGNKADMDESKRAVPTAKGQALADEYGIKFFETSAKTNLNVEEVFFSIGRDIKQRLADSDTKQDAQGPITIKPIDQQSGNAAPSKSACCS
ncbi:hypothetical protein KSS87_022418 [Heliosperma pusillum]|nr:hypothetical protein KSS87_022418 [Heliosperma pusillum]